MGGEMSVGDTIYTFRCPNCKTVAITDLKPQAGRPERCKCGVWLRFLYTTPMTDEARALLKRAPMVFNPYAERTAAWYCVRCEQPIMLMTHWKRRPDGLVCAKCYQAEERPAEMETAS